MLFMIDGKIQVVSDWPEIGSKCEMETDKPTMGLRNRKALDMLHEAMQNQAMQPKAWWEKLFD